MHIWCKFCDSSSNLLKSQISKNSKSKLPTWPWWSQSVTSISYHADKPNFLEFWAKWPKWPWSSQSMTPILNTNWEFPLMNVWWKFGDSNSNLWWLIVQTRKSLWTDGHMDRWTDAGMTLPLWPERPGVNIVYIIIRYKIFFQKDVKTKRSHGFWNLFFR